MLVNVPNKNKRIDSFDAFGDLPVLLPSDSALDPGPGLVGLFALDPVVCPADVHIAAALHRRALGGLLKRSVSLCATCRFSGETHLRVNGMEGREVGNETNRTKRRRCMTMNPVEGDAICNRRITLDIGSVGID